MASLPIEPSITFSASHCFSSDEGAQIFFSHLSLRTSCHTLSIGMASPLCGTCHTWCILETSHLDVGILMYLSYCLYMEKLLPHFVQLNGSLVFKAAFAKYCVLE